MAKRETDPITGVAKYVASGRTVLVAVAAIFVGGMWADDFVDKIVAELEQGPAVRQQIQTELANQQQAVAQVALQYTNLDARLDSITATQGDMVKVMAAVWCHVQEESRQSGCLSADLDRRLRAIIDKWEVGGS